MLLTVEQVGVYAKYRGDEDGFSRVASSAEKTLMKGVNWPRLSELLQSLSIARQGLSSSEFERSAQEAIQTICSDQKALEALIELAG